MDTLVSEFFGEETLLTHLTALLACILGGLVLRWAIFSALRFYNRKKPTLIKEQLLKYLKRPAKFFIPLLLIYTTLVFYSELNALGHKVVEALLIMNFAWMLMALLQALEVVVKEKFQINGPYKAKERKVVTQLRFIKSVAIVVIITLSVASILWNIPAARELGETILTSAGIIGIIVGVAAQKSIANLITGFQLAFTQPLKIDDQVIIEGEFGTVEDITLTYVVVKTWDWRRLVLPLNYFNEKPFVNWSFNSSKLIGSVFFYVDYTFPVPELRTELSKVLTTNPLWDKDKADLLVTNIDDRAMELRATFSSKNASDIWNLRCTVREQLMEFIQEKHPDALPKFRGTDAQIPFMGQPKRHG